MCTITYERGRLVPLAPITCALGVVVGLLGTSCPGATVPLLQAAEEPRVRQEGLVFLDGQEVAGHILSIEDGQVRCLERPEPTPLYELGALVFAPPTGAAVKEADPGAGPVAVFRDGETLLVRVASATARSATLELDGLLLEVPTEALKAFRLREAHAADDLFEADLKSASPPSRDTVYVRRGASLLRVEGVFQSLDSEFLALEYDGQTRKLRRQLVLGMMFAPLATATVEPTPPSVIELEKGGHLSAILVALRSQPVRSLVVRFPGAASQSLVEIPVARVARVKLASDRIVFLSALEPARVEQTPFVGVEPGMVWRRNACVAGGPLRLGGKTYRKGLGVCSRTALEYDVRGQGKTFSAVVGLDDAAGPEAGVTVRVLADGKEIFSRDLTRAAKPENLVLPLDGVVKLRLEVDFGPDGVDFGDYVNWADARWTKN